MLSPDVTAVLVVDSEDFDHRGQRAFHLGSPGRIPRTSGYIGILMGCNGILWWFNGILWGFNGILWGLMGFNLI